jgi:hypothetical protein
VIYGVHLRDFMGVAVVEYQFPERGACIAGANGTGKTTVLRAIRAALAAQDVGADAIRAGADSAEILIDLGDVTVRRLLSHSSSTLTVAQDGVRVKAPQAFLSKLLGTSPLDPLDLFLESDGRARRARILEALPISVSAAQLATWLPAGFDPGSVLGRGPDGPDVSGHGLEVVERLRKAIAELRAGANREAEARDREREIAEARAGSAHAAVVREAQGEEVPSVEHAANVLQQATQAQADLRARRSAARAALERASTTRLRVEQLRGEAQAMRAKAAALAVAPTMRDAALEHQAKAEADLATLDEACASLAAQLAATRSARERVAVDVCDARDRVLSLAAAEADALRANDEAIAKDDQAAQLAEAAGTADPGPTPADEAAAEAATERAMRIVRAAQLARDAERAAAERENVARQLEAVRARAADYDAAVKRLRNDAPAILLAAANGIPGLTLDGDDVLLDGVSIDRLSGAERMRFAVEIARRLNARSKLIVVDGLEALDDEQRTRFVELATADGYQLIATRVSTGPAHLEQLGGAP